MHYLLILFFLVSPFLPLVFLSRARVFVPSLSLLPGPKATPSALILTARGHAGSSLFFLSQLGHPEAAFPVGVLGFISSAMSTISSEFVSVNFPAMGTRPKSFPALLFFLFPFTLRVCREPFRHHPSYQMIVDDPAGISPLPPKTLFCLPQFLSSKQNNFDLLVPSNFTPKSREPEISFVFAVRVCARGGGAPVFFH